MNTFGRRSRQRLEGVRKPLVEVTTRALELSPIDFGIVCGLRSFEEQVGLVDQGQSQTLKSLHLVGHAIDFAPYWARKYREAWPFFYPIADAFKTASMELGTPIKWGGAWGMDLWRFKSAQEAQEAYIMKREASGKDDVFLDGPHIELCRETYPPDFSSMPELIMEA